MLKQATIFTLLATMLTAPLSNTLASLSITSKKKTSLLDKETKGKPLLTVMIKSLHKENCMAKIANI